MAFLCFVVFIVLKLCGAIDDWSWGYVLLPGGVYVGQVIGATYEGLKHK